MSVATMEETREIQPIDSIRSIDDAAVEIDADAAWEAVQARDERHDGAFVFAVRTTGVYCRPSCPSRRPLRRNVAFFRTPDEAERGGYRACKRCRPKSQTDAERQVRKAREYLEAHLDEQVTLEALARAVAMSPFHLQRTFKRLVGLSPKAYQNARRLERFKASVRRGDTVSRATYEAGFGSSRGLYEQAGAGLGMTPGAYRRGGRGLRVAFGVFDSGLGRVLVAATERGVCTAALGDDDAALEAALRRELPHAEVERDDDAVRPWADPILRQLAGAAPDPASEAAPPLDLQGTDFEVSVWRALQRIPRGETRTYAEVAASLGRPSAARAVARACAGNRVCLVVPCHRVIRGDGALAGYRWGVDRKRRLLEMEGVRASG